MSSRGAVSLAMSARNHSRRLCLQAFRAEKCASAMGVAENDVSGSELQPDDARAEASVLQALGVMLQQMQQQSLLLCGLAHKIAGILIHLVG